MDDTHAHPVPLHTSTATPALSQNKRYCIWGQASSLASRNPGAVGAGAFLGLLPEVRSCYVTLPALTSVIFLPQSSDGLDYTCHHVWFGNRAFRCLRVYGHVWRSEADTGNLSIALQLVSEAGSPQTLNLAPCRGISPLPHKGWDPRLAKGSLGFYKGSGDPNSGPQASTEGAICPAQRQVLERA